jgi:hypothetical protein
MILKLGIEPQRAQRTQRGDPLRLRFIGVHPEAEPEIFPACRECGEVFAFFVLFAANSDFIA